jgi:hypothetical protein
MKPAIALFATVALALVVSPSWAETPREKAETLAKPGAGHTALKALLGKWKSVTTTAMTKKDGKPLTFGGTVERTSILGDRYVRESYAGKGPMGQSYSGVGYIGHDNAGQVYQGVWLTTFNTHMVQYSGTLSGSTFTFHGQEGGSGASKSKRFVMTLEMKSPKEHVLTQYYVNGDKSRTKSFSIVYTRP